MRSRIDQALPPLQPTPSNSVVEWIRARLLGVALSAASFITLVSLIAPSWLDFLLDLSMIGLIAVVGKLARRR